MNKIVLLILLLCGVLSINAQYATLDEIVFGNTLSEQKHSLEEKATKLINGEANATARLLLPIEGQRVEGGNVSFNMKVNPKQQNYITVRFWGSDTGDKNLLILFIEGKQVGYRHLGDYDMLSIGNGEAPYPGRFTYTTLPLPKKYTQNKTQVSISIRSTGPIYRYGETFDAYQKQMTEPSKALYSAYTHVNPYIQVEEKEQLAVVPKTASIRTTPGIEVLAEVKAMVNAEITKQLNKERNTQNEIQFLADAYFTQWSSAYNNKTVIDKAIALADEYVKEYDKNPETVTKDSWVTTGPLAIALRYLFTHVEPQLNHTLPNGKTRKVAYASMFSYCVDYAKTHRRSYTNQGMIVDWCLYEVNRTLSLIAPEQALPQEQTLNYLYEAVGLKPWQGSYTPNGSTWPLGKNYYQLTNKGLTKELGFVGGYGEIAYWAMHIYNATAERGIFNSGDQKIKEQLIKMAKARTYFRYPSQDEQGYKAMRAEAVIGWRDPEPYPGYVIYGEKGVTRETTPLMVTATTLDPDLVAYAQQMFDDNQFFYIIKQKMKDRTISSFHTLLRVPDEYALIQEQPRKNRQLPMTVGQPDFVFSDEEAGVVAIKNGTDIFYASLYWRSNYAVNFLARVHYTTATTDRIATVFQNVEYTPSGMIYKRPERINMAFSNARNFYPGIQSAHTGEELPIAKIPEGVHFKPGNENVYAGKGDFYRLQYGKYLIGMNTTNDKTFLLQVPAGYRQVLELTNSKNKVLKRQLDVMPRSTIVLELVNK